MSLSALPDDILNLISIRLNGFDNCFLWMASDSILRQRLVNNVITEFNVIYTTPGRYLWPGNFLKRLQRLSRLSLVVDEDLFHIPIQDVELHPIPSLQELKLHVKNACQIFSKRSTDLTGPTASTTESMINLNDFYCNLEYLSIEGHSETRLSIDFLRFLPQKLKTLSIPYLNSLQLDDDLPLNDEDLSQHMNKHFEVLPRTLTALKIYFFCANQIPALNLSKLPPNLTSLSTNALIEENSYHMIPKKLELIDLYEVYYNMEKLSPFLPTGLRGLSIGADVSLANTSLSHLKQLEEMWVNVDAVPKLVNLPAKCPPNLKTFGGSHLRLPDFSIFPFGNNIVTLNLRSVENVGRDFMASLPQSLTDLQITRARQDTAAEFAFFRLLPRSLKSLVTNFTIIESTSLLPDSLTSLALEPGLEGRLDIFDSLPPKLETLELIAALPQSILTKLPTTLKSLSLFSRIEFDDESVSILPRGLKSISISTSFESITDASASFWPPNLEHLNIKEAKMTDHAISKLPRTLKSLYLTKNQNLTDECIKDLPPNLIQLNLFSPRITSKSFKDLPKYLRILDLRNCKNLTVGSFADLPKFLHRLQVASPQLNAAWHSFCIQRNLSK